MNPSTNSIHPPQGVSVIPQRVTVIGCGYVGLTVSVGLAELGHQVIGMDIDQALVERLRAGAPHIEEPQLDHYLRRGLDSGRLSFSSSYEDSVGEAAFIVLAVGTPQSLAGAADMRSIRSAMRSVVDNLNGTAPIIVNKSTSPIGTGETIEHFVSEALAEGVKPPKVVSNPEFLRQGRAVRDFFRPDRIVVGSRSREEAQRVADLYASLDAPVIMTDLRTSEMIKYVANSFLATRISFINEIARLCEQIGADIDMVVGGVAQDERIGGHFFHAGIGFGGSCLPKDTAALRYIGETFGVATPLLSAVQEVNVAARTSAVRRLRTRLGTLEGKRIGVWGLTFKGGTDDTRDSPAIDVVELLLNEGTIIQAFDPSVVRDEWRVPASLRGRLSPSALEAVDGADAVAVLTDWPEFAQVPLDEAWQRMRGSVMFDGRNLIPRDKAEAAGFAYIGVGRVPTMHRRRASDT